MAPLQLRVRVGTTDDFSVEIDEDETVEDLAVLVLSQRPDLGEEELPRLVFRGKVLKIEQTMRELNIQPTDFIVAAAAKKPQEEPSAAAAAAPAAAAAAAASPPPEVAAQAMPTAPPDSAAGQPTEQIISTLIDMGFQRDQVVKALAAAFNNPDRAVEYLFGGIPATAQAAPPVAAPVPAAAPSGAPGNAWAVQTLGPQLLSKQGVVPTQQALSTAKVVALYFSAHWCPPCRQFTPVLATAMSMNRWPQLAVVFVSSDRDATAFSQYYSEMPWLALPFEAPQRQMLGGLYQVRGIPSLIVLDAATGRQLSADGRGDVQRNNFDIGSCLRQWGVSETTPSTNSAAAASATTAPAAPKKLGPPPLPIDDEAATQALQRVDAEPYEVQEAFFKTGLKVLENILQNPGDAKFRQLKKANAALSSKLLSVADKAGEVLVELAGFVLMDGEDGGTWLMESPPDGRCTAVRERLQAAATKAWEKKAREERDARIKEEMEKDKGRSTRYGGGGGRMDVGRGRGPSRGGG